MGSLVAMAIRGVIIVIRFSSRVVVVLVLFLLLSRRHSARFRTIVMLYSCSSCRCRKRFKFCAELNKRNEDDCWKERRIRTVMFRELENNDYNDSLEYIVMFTSYYSNKTFSHKA